MAPRCRSFSQAGLRQPAAIGAGLLPHIGLIPQRPREQTSTRPSADAGEATSGSPWSAPGTCPDLLPAEPPRGSCKVLAAVYNSVLRSVLRAFPIPLAAPRAGPFPRQARNLTGTRNRMPSNPLAIVAYLSLFAGVGLVFLFANLLVGRFVRPANPNQEKLEIYECGEPSIGSSFVQFDLRFYVVALLFIIFDVEVAFFFPWATVFGKATNLANQDNTVAVATAPVQDSDTHPSELTANTEYLYREMGIRNTELPLTVQASATDANTKVRDSFSTLAKFTLIDIGIFFAVLIVGFFYVWKRGDLDWVRAVSEERALPDSRNDASPSAAQEPVLSP